MEILLDPTGFTTPLFAVLASVLLAQGIKLFLDFKARRKSRLFENGGMPSSHSALVLSLVFVILFETGLSLLFLFALVFAAIVLNDATGVREETTRHSQFLNQLIKEEKFRRVGHEPLEVFIGAMIGVVVTIAIYAFF